MNVACKVRRNALDYYMKNRDIPFQIGDNPIRISWAGKIIKLLELKERMDFEIYWDGACGADRILEFAPRGVRGFVLGTTLLFGKNRSYGEILQDIRQLNI